MPKNSLWSYDHSMHACVLRPCKNAARRRWISLKQIKLFVWDILYVIWNLSGFVKSVGTTWYPWIQETVCCHWEFRTLLRNWAGSKLNCKQIRWSDSSLNVYSSISEIIHPSIHPSIAVLPWGLKPSSCHWGRGDQNSGNVASPSQVWHRGKQQQQQHTLTLLPAGSLDSPINL